MLDIPKDEVEELKKKIQLYISVNRFEAAEKLLKSTLADYGPLAHLHNLLGTIYHRQSRFVDALRQFEVSIEINPKYVEAGLNLVATLCDLSRYEEAREVFENMQKLISPRTKQPDLIMGRLANRHASSGDLYEDSGMLAEALQEYRRALSLYEDMPDIRMKLAKLLILTGQFEKAQQELELIVRKAPEMTDARNYLGILYYKLGKHDLAKHQWEKAQVTDPNDLTSRAYLSIYHDNPVSTNI